jgi:hypothetical protein
LNDLNVLLWPAKPCFFELSVLLTFGHRVYVDTAYYAFLPPEFGCYIGLNLGSLAGIFLGIQMLHELLPDCHSKFSLCVPVFLEQYFKFINSALHNYHYSALHLLLLFSNDYNKPTKFQPKSCDWICEYQLSVQHEPHTSFPQVTNRLVNTGVSDKHHHALDTTQWRCIIL